MPSTARRIHRLRRLHGLRGLRRLTAAAAGLAVFAALALLSPGTAAAAPTSRQPTTPIRHFVYLMQGARSFDSYFGSYPGADGIPAGACLPVAAGRPCLRPSQQEFASAGAPAEPLRPSASLLDAEYGNGRMDGFASAYQRRGLDPRTALGHYDSRALPFTWAAARQYVLYDHFFSSADYGTGANRAYWVTGGSPTVGQNRSTIFGRLQSAGVSWKIYVEHLDPATARAPSRLGLGDGPLLRSHLADLSQYYRDLSSGRLPSVAYVLSRGSDETSARSIPAGQALIRNLVTQLQLSSAWSSTALLWSYDASGGWYDHVPPPTAADGRRLGMRVPALLVSPYARPGRVDHTVLDPAAALAFIERNWRLAPLSSRDARYLAQPAGAGLARALDFSAGPRTAALVRPGAAGGDAHPPLVRTAVIYWFYGGAAVLALLLILWAATAQRIRNGRPPGSLLRRLRKAVTR